MGDIRNEFASGGFKVADVGDILKNEKHGLREGTGFGRKSSDVNVEMPLSRGSFGSDGFETEFDLLGCTACQCVLTGVLEFMPAKILQHSATNGERPGEKEFRSASLTSVILWVRSMMRIPSTMPERMPRKLRSSLAIWRSS